MRSTRRVLAAVLAASLIASGGTLRAAGTDEQKSWEDVIPLTAGNLRGHKMLYDEGWYAVSSSRQAFADARKSAVVSSAEAVREAAESVSRRGRDLSRDAADDAAGVKKTGVAIQESANARSSAIVKETGRVSHEEFAYAEEDFALAAQDFVLGSVGIAKRTQEDRRELADLPGNYFKDMRGDFGDVYDKAAQARRRFAEKIDPAWEESFHRAGRDFRGEYDKSGDAGNTLTALGPLLAGYLKAFYHGLAAPAAKTLVSATAAGASAVFLPTAAATIVAGRTVESAGLTVYYAGRTGVHVLSPTVEGGFFAGVALLSLGAVPVTFASGMTLGAVNQAAFTAASPAAAAGLAASAATYDSGVYVSSILYDAGTGATKVVIDEATAGATLGYNALTALPAQTLLGVGDAAVFLAWDGPRLLLATARGRVRYGKNGKDYSVGALPAGTVVNMKALRRAEGITVETLSTDPAVLRGVLEKLPADVRRPDAPR